MAEKTTSKKTPAKKAAPAKAAPAKAARPAAKAQKAPAVPAKKPGKVRTPEGIDKTIFEQVMTACLLDNEIRAIIYGVFTPDEVPAKIRAGRLRIKAIALKLGAPPAAIDALLNSLQDDDLLAFSAAAKDLNKLDRVGA